MWLLVVLHSPISFSCQSLSDIKSLFNVMLLTICSGCSFIHPVYFALQIFLSVDDSIEQLPPSPFVFCNENWQFFSPTKCHFSINMVLTSTPSKFWSLCGSATLLPSFCILFSYKWKPHTDSLMNVSPRHPSVSVLPLLCLFDSLWLLT